MCVTIRNSMHGVLLLPSLKKQRELIQGPISFAFKCNETESIIERRPKIIINFGQFSSKAKGSCDNKDVEGTDLCLKVKDTFQAFSCNALWDIFKSSWKY